MDKLLTSLLVVAVTVAVASSLKCVPCDQTTCVPPPPGCELGRRVCSCCNECRVPEGGRCGPFTAEWVLRFSIVLFSLLSIAYVFCLSFSFFLVFFLLSPRAATTVAIGSRGRQVLQNDNLTVKNDEKWDGELIHYHFWVVSSAWNWITGSVLSQKKLSRLALYVIFHLF